MIPADLDHVACRQRSEVVRCDVGGTASAGAVLFPFIPSFGTDLLVLMIPQVLLLSVALSAVELGLLAL